MQEIAECVEEMYEGLSKSDSRLMRKANDRCIAFLAVSPSPLFLSLSVISYVLSKILSKPRYMERKANQDYLKAIKDELLTCRGYIRSEKEVEVGESIKKMLKVVEQLNASDRRFFLGLEEKAKLKIAVTLYAQGFSLGRASEITGVDEREILKYAGGTMMFDRLPERRGIGERVSIARRIFG
ncbi:MAG: hypothetical protein QXW70_03730 [Candidatus Anstonellales archaeon]